jgi:hypothetical protein
MFWDRHKHNWEVVRKDRCVAGEISFWQFGESVTSPSFNYQAVAVLEVCTSCGEKRAYAEKSNGRRIYFSAAFYEMYAPKQ